MQRFAFLFLVVLAFGACPPRAVFARNDNSMYAVHGIAVDASADTAAAARDKAIAQGARKGLEQLMHDLGAGDGGKLPPTITDRTAGPLVQDFEVESERSSPGRYIARLGFRYKPDGVRVLLASSGGRYVSARAPLLLVVPVYRSSAGDLLWQPGNPWRDAWRDAPGRAGLVPVVVPAGTPEDLQAFTAADLASPDKLAALAQRYKAENAVVVSATAISATGEPGEGLRLTLLGGGGPDMAFKSDGAASPAQALEQGVTATLAQFDLAWKQHVLKGTAGAIAFKAAPPVAEPPPSSETAQPSGNAYALQAQLSAPGEWASLRTRLGQAAGITRVDLKSLTRDAAIVVVNATGNEDQLIQSLAAAGMVLGPPQAVPSEDGELASMVPATGPGAGFIYPLSSTGIVQ